MGSGLRVSGVLIAEEDNARALEANMRILREVLDQHCASKELLIVQNGSGADAAVESVRSIWPGCEIVRYEHKQVYGIVLKTGIRRSHLPYILVADAANEVALESIELMLRSAPSADMVIGRRGRAREGLRGTVYAWAWSNLAQLLFGLDAGDVDCPVKLIRRAKLEQIGFLESQGEIFHTELLARMTGARARVLECPLLILRPVGRKLGRVGLVTIGWLLWQLTTLWFRIRRLRRRHQRESAFHDDWAQNIDISKIDVAINFEATTAAENRYCLERMGDLSGKKLLDLGCGVGETSTYFALQGADVTAVDISKGMIRRAQTLAGRYRVHVDARVMLAEDLNYDDNTFDIVFGNGVLHHTYRPAAYAEVHRVLKPGGLGIFIEPLSYNPLLWAYRRIARTVRTEYEKPFGYRDFTRLRKIFAEVEHREFWVVCLAIFLRMFLVEWLHPAKVRYWKHILTHHAQYDRLYEKLRRIDDSLLTHVPMFGLLAWNTVIVLRKAKDPESQHTLAEKSACVSESRVA